MHALITDAHIRSAVAGLRALGRAGIRTVAMAPGRTGAGLWSRYAAAREIGPDSSRQPERLAQAVAAAGERHGPLVVYPGHEPAIDALFEAGLPESVTLPYPSSRVTGALRDKAQLAEMAERVGLAAPRTLLEARAGGIPPGSVELPCAVKPARTGGALDTTRVVVDERELRELLDSLPADEPLLIQERAEEPLVGLALVVGRDGSQVARFQQVAERTWPERAGGSTVAVSVEPDLDLAERATTLLAGAGYWGLAQLQFLTTDRGPALIDVNTRFYGSMPLALAAGVNLPAAWHAVVMDRADGQPPPYRAGVRYRWLEGEIVAGLRGSPGRLLPLRPRPKAGAVWLRDDPVPSALLAAELGWSRVARRGRKMRSKA